MGPQSTGWLSRGRFVLYGCPVDAVPVASSHPSQKTLSPNTNHSDDPMLLRTVELDTEQNDDPPQFTPPRKLFSMRLWLAFTQHGEARSTPNRLDGLSLRHGCSARRSGLRNPQRAAPFEAR